MRPAPGLIAGRLQFQDPGTRECRRPLRQPVELQRPLLRSQHNPLIEVAIALVDPTPYYRLRTPSGSGAPEQPKARPILV
jgi:hypothetical protein